ncbi:MAG: DUF2240 family protein [Nanoarchaeota archaeon]|nr:DUF2240 family protein [Nanoarchaeota archaeon]
MNLEQIVEKIVSVTQQTKEDANKKILEKQRELSMLVSIEGAAYIVAKELGLDLMEKTSHKLQIKNIIAGMRSLTLAATVAKIFPLREFERNGKKSRVANIILGDETGTARLSLWDEQTDLLQQIKENTVIEIKNGYTREDNLGGVEIRLGRQGAIKQLDQAPLKIEIKKSDASISKVREGGTYEIRAALLHVFDSSPFYEVCPQCGSRIKMPDFKCAEHGEMKPAYAMVVSGVIDDGTANMRIVFFRESAEKVLGMKTAEALAKKASLFETLENLGKEFVFSGRVRKNQLFERLEFITSDFQQINPADEARKLLKEFEGAPAVV